MGKKTENLENFKKAITSTIKSIVGDQNINIIFGNELAGKNINTIKLPDIQSINNKIDYIKTRALADSEALKLRCSDIDIYNSFEPQGNIAKLLYAVAEKVRYENIGSSYFKGIKENLNQYQKLKINQNKDNNYGLVDAFESYLRNKVFKLNDSEKIDNKYKKYKKKLDIKFNNKLDVLSSSVFNQKKYNSLISKVISQMQIDEGAESERNEDSQKNEDSLENKSNEQKKHEMKESETNDMSIDTNLPDLDQLSSEVDSEIEVEGDDKSLNSPKKNRENGKNFGDSKYKYYTHNL